MRFPFMLYRPIFLALLLASIANPATADEPEMAVGRKIASFSLRDFQGKTWSMPSAEEKPLLVAVFLGVECPLVKLYAPRLNALAGKYADQGVVFVGINSNQQDALSEMAAFARRNEVAFPQLKDLGNQVADDFGARRTPEVFVLDAQRVVRYHGRIDDQYTYGIQKPKVEHEYLVEALDALLAGHDVALPETEVVGCHIGRVLQPQADSTVTYANQISRILQERCVECHREGEIAPFALTNYDEVVGWAEMVAEVVDQQRMPPWHADPAHGAFANDARLTEDEKSLILAWVKAGAPQGDLALLPAPRPFAPGWRIGQPDQVIYMSDEPFQAPAEGEVRYQYFEVDPGFTEDKWIRAAECRPDNRSVVHHIIVGIKPRGSRERRVHGGENSSWLAATAPGGRPMDLPPHMAKFVPAGSKLVFQMHYTPNGSPQKDRSCVGLIFADSQKVTHKVLTQEIVNTKFLIPAGASAHPVKASFRFPISADITAMFPHMHLRGKSFRYTAVYPDQSREILLDVPRYDFNWQNAYVLSEPKHMPAGARIECEATFDNSADNLANPDPHAEVRWGDQTWEEMMIGYFDIIVPRQDDKRGPRTEEFLQRPQQQEPELDQELKAAARESLQSDDKLSRQLLLTKKPNH